jgi:ankyrin repeat protein
LFDGQNVNINCLGGPENQSCLHLAAQNSFYDIVELLVDHGADTFIRNKKYQTPLSSINNNLLMIKLLKKCEKGFFRQ